MSVVAMPAFQPKTKLIAALLLQSFANGAMAWATLIATVFRDKNTPPVNEPLNWSTGDPWGHRVAVLWDLLDVISLFACLALAVVFVVSALGIRRNWRWVRATTIVFEAVAISVCAVTLINSYVTLDGKAVAVLTIALAIYAVVFLRDPRRTEKLVHSG